MPRKQRFYLPGIPAHVMQRGHNRNPIFFSDEDYRKYLRILKKAADQYECQVHAYVLMTNHVHLLLTPFSKESISQLFQALGRTYVTYINKNYQRSGTLWEGRHKGHIIDSEEYFLTCMQYIELNPVRAEMVKHPAEYYWSSYSANGLGQANAILTPHDEYLLLSRNKSERLKRYSELLESKIDAQQLNDFRRSAQSGTPLGSQRFLGHIEKQLACKLGHMKRGRPCKKTVGS